MKDQSEDELRRNWEKNGQSEFDMTLGWREAARDFQPALFTSATNYDEEC